MQVMEHFHSVMVMEEPMVLLVCIALMLEVILGNMKGHQWPQQGHLYLMDLLKQILNQETLDMVDYLFAMEMEVQMVL